jgi:hypothetical protein
VSKDWSVLVQLLSTHDRHSGSIIFICDTSVTVTPSTPCAPLGCYVRACCPLSFLTCLTDSLRRVYTMFIRKHISNIVTRTIRERVRFASFLSMSSSRKRTARFHHAFIGRRGCWIIDHSNCRRHVSPKAANATWSWLMHRHSDICN